MTDVPRRVELSGADKVAVVAQRAAPGSLAGATQWHRPAAARTPTPQNAFNGGDKLGRLSVNWFTSSPATALSSHVTNINGWDSTFDHNGTQVGLNPAGDDGGIYFFDSGIYAVNLLLQVGAIRAAPTNCEIRFNGTVWDVPADSGEIFDVGLTGIGDSTTVGWSPSAGASRIFYSPGGGVAGAGVTFQIQQANISGAGVGSVWVLATVQQIA